MAIKNINTDLQVNSSAQFGSSSYQGDMNGGKADLSVDCGGTSQISWVGNYFQVGGTDLNYNMRATAGLIDTWSQDLTIRAGNTGTTAKLRLGTNGQTSTIVCDDGNVGIGTASPESKLHIVDSNSSIQLRLNQTGNNDAVLGSGTNFFTIKTGTAGNTNALSILHSNQNVGIGTTSPSEKLDVNGIASTSSYFKYKGHSLNMSYGQGGSDSVLFDYTHYSDQAFLSVAADGENFNTTSSSEWVASSDHPFAGGKVLQTSGYRYFYSDYIPVTPGEELYGEIYTKYISGSGGVLYYGIEQFDSEKNAIGGNTGTTYFVSSNFNATSTSWTKKSNYTTLATTHTPYNGSNGGGVYYVRIRILFNYPSGGAVRQFGGIMLKRTGVAHDQLISGEVGIGTTTLTNSSGYSTLSISGTTGGQIAFQTSGTGKHYLYSSALDFNIYNSQAGNIRLYTNASERMRINSSGNVGIGTTSPSAPLSFGKSVYGATTSENFFRIKFKDNGGIANDVGIGQSDVNSLNFNKCPAGIFSFNDGTNGEVMRIHSDGNVGIGTTSPKSILELASNNPVINFKDTTAGTDLSYRYIQNVDGKFLFAKANDAYNSFTTHMAIDTNGNVGIGTTDPSHRLEIRSTTATHELVSINRPNSNTAALYIGNDSSSPANGVIASNYSDLILGRDQSGTLTEHVRIKRDGNVGIGTTGPTAPLDVLGVRAGRDWSIANRATIRLDSNGTGSPSDILFGHTAAANQSSWTGAYWAISSRGSSASNKFYFYRGSGNPSNATEAVIMAFNPNGKVGIGTTDPGTKLEIDQSANTYASGLSLRNAGNVIYGMFVDGSNNLNFHYQGSPKVVFESGGNVGIGTTSPSTTLDVNGITTSDAFRTDTSNTVYNVISRNSTSGTLWVQAAQSNSTQTILSCRYGSATVAQGTEVLAVRRNSSYFINTKLGVGTNNPGKTLDVSGEVRVSNGDLEVVGSSEGVILTAPSGGRYRISVNDSGELQTSAV